MSDWEFTFTAYAALVSTVVLFLELRRWVESGARLVVAPASDMVTYNVPATEGQTFVSVVVVNRGNAPTTLTHLVLLEYVNPLRKWRNKPSRAAFVANPAVSGQPMNIPAVLSPGERWMGMVSQDAELEEWMASARLYVGVHASHADKPIVVKLKRQLISEDERSVEDGAA